MIDQNWKEAMRLYNGMCIHCFGRASSVHEIVPKSLAPQTWNRLENRVPLCIACHSWAQTDTEVTGEVLEADKLRALKILGKTSL
jgi:5-methylcytosine-specific restriction endonuclease McrA